MSVMKSFIYLPDYILDYVVDEATPRINPDRILVTATPTELLEIIVAFYPHFKFTEDAQKDIGLLRMIFCNMVSTRLSNLVVPSVNDTKHYQVAFLRGPILAEQCALIIVGSLEDINQYRMGAFNQSALGFLNKGHYSLPAANLQSYLDTYKVADEMEENYGAQTNAEEPFRDCTSDDTEYHESIEDIQLQSPQPNFSPIEQKDLAKVAQDVGSISACANLHSTAPPPPDQHHCSQSRANLHRTAPPPDQHDCSLYCCLLESLLD